MNALRTPDPGQCRQMLYTDLSKIIAIEKQAYEFPWTEGIFRDCIRVDYHCQVMEAPDCFIQAYGVMSTAIDEAHILNLCVRPALQGHGLSRQMLDHLLERAHLAKAKTVFLEVRPSNTAAIRLYSVAGFCEIGIRPNYYPATHGREDALIMAKTL
ncbi:MAG: ribosomal-protein-alanine N-acetyltransferase [Candidatus Contendobacter odensis]|uniref:[Ribosomal protein bS18]-alanine N-acetyltransferase n=1 Tax=Candidatus Contendibacter odensensis TaxID=1400860 RepID=A0A2G6PFV5_9GAMM|nr:MAG: ribosomal-protein-alanine N-acetyltransferase [Candidatus Contendobacter odensis]